jgi:hypothetical protein
MKTAIEWLVEKTFSDFGKSVLRQEIKMALELEKQQIINAHVSGYNSGETGEEYYNEIYDKTIKK